MGLWTLHGVYRARLTLSPCVGRVQPRAGARLQLSPGGLSAWQPAHDIGCQYDDVTGLGEQWSARRGVAPTDRPLNGQKTAKTCLMATSSMPNTQ